MADSEEDICNMALALIGHTRQIDSLTADGTEEADVCNTFYAQDRDEVLSAFAWPFATTRQKPAPIVATTLAAGAVPGGWLYAFAVPAGTLRVRSIFSAFGLPSAAANYSIEFDSTLGSQIILTNDDEPEFLFTTRITDVKQFSPLFVRALAGKLAEDLVLGLRKDPKFGQTAHAYYMQALAAATADALSGINPQSWTPAHIAARG